MKKVILMILTVIFSISFCSAQQDYKELIKERKEIAKFTDKQRKARVYKDARKSAKKYAKEGWQVAPGALPLEKQLDKCYSMQNEIDLASGLPKYIMGEATTIGQHYDAAKMQATNTAKIQLAGNVQTEVAALIEDRTANKQLQPEEAASVSSAVQGAKSMITQSIGRVIPGMELYRKLNNKNVEVRVQIFYNAEMAFNAAKKAIREDLEKKADKLVDQLDNILGF